MKLTIAITVLAVLICALLFRVTYAPPKTSPLPIVNPCHRCGMEHDEMHPTEACKRLVDAEQETEQLNDRIKELEALLELAFDTGYDCGHYTAQEQSTKAEFRKIKKPEITSYKQLARANGIETTAHDIAGNTGISCGCAV